GTRPAQKDFLAVRRFDWSSRPVERTVNRDARYIERSASGDRGRAGTQRAGTRVPGAGRARDKPEECTFALDQTPGGAGHDDVVRAGGEMRAAASVDHA